MFKISTENIKTQEMTIFNVRDSGMLFPLFCVLFSDFGEVILVDQTCLEQQPRTQVTPSEVSDFQGLLEGGQHISETKVLSFLPLEPDLGAPAEPGCYLPPCAGCSWLSQTKSLSFGEDTKSPLLELRTLKAFWQKGL